MSEEIYQQRKNKLMEYYQNNNSMPTYDELLKMFKLKSKGSLHKYLKRFFEEGVVEKGPTGRLMPTSQLFGLRVLGTVQAGFPSPAEEELADTMSLDEWLVEKPTASYMLKVTGESMLDAGIMPDDMVLIERGKDPRQGDIVIAQVDDEWTMKYYIKENNKIILRPGNKKFKDIHPDQEMKIAGVVTSVIRKYK